jgi:hypothetical protein
MKNKQKYILNQILTFVLFKYALEEYGMWVVTIFSVADKPNARENPSQ